MTLDNIVEEIKNAKNILILTHQNPDGDAVGSSMALYNALKRMEKDVDVVIPAYPKVFNFLPNIDKVKKEVGSEKYDLVIVLDCGDIKRINGFEKNFEEAKCKIAIDHHSVNTMFADYNFINPTAPACAQILITVLEALNVEIDNEIGTCILTGILTDTGGFKYPSTSVETFEFTAELLRRGINVSEIYQKVLQKTTMASFKLRKIAINRLELLENNQIAITYITEQDLKEVEAMEGDCDGIVDIGRDIEGVEVSIFLKEIEKEHYKISLRSNNYVNVSDICLLFNGGGHVRASGGSITGTIESVKSRIIEECKKHLKSKE